MRRFPRDLLLLILLGALPWAARPRKPPAIGPPLPLRPCPVLVEAVGAGVGCVSEDDARRAGVRTGDRLRLDGDGRLVRERMAPVRLAAWRLPVDVNHASLGELASLDGVGPRIAGRIVDARPFASVDDLTRVPGLGGRRVDRLRERLTVRLDE